LNLKTAKLQNCKTAKLQNRKTAKPQNVKCKREKGEGRREKEKIVFKWKSFNQYSLPIYILHLAFYILNFLNRSS